MPILPLPGKTPKIDPTVFLAESATVIGDVTIGPQSGIWFQSVVRGDVHWIRIGARTNVQDLCMIHVTHRDWPTTLEDDVTVGHGVTLHGCHVKSRVLVGIGAILLDGVVVESDSMIAAGSVVAPGTRIPQGVLAMGSPAKVKRDLWKEELDFLKVSARNYVEYQEMYRRG
jgi:carbonic anhydrase/acetyltransferase-like protein (isoleucine patch superfamily)